MGGLQAVLCWTTSDRVISEHNVKQGVAGGSLNLLAIWHTIWKGYDKDISGNNRVLFKLTAGV